LSSVSLLPPNHRFISVSTSRKRGALATASGKEADRTAQKKEKNKQPPEALNNTARPRRRPPRWQSAAGRNQSDPAVKPDTLIQGGRGAQPSPSTFVKNVRIGLYAQIDICSVWLYNALGGLMKIVCHAQKLTGFGMGSHVDRVGFYETDGSIDREKHKMIVNPELFKYNCQGGTAAAEWEKVWKEEVGKLDRKPQAGRNKFGDKKELVTMFEFTFSASSEFFDGLRRDNPGEFHANCEKYFSDCRKEIDKLYPDSPTLSWVTHYDESVPHMHLQKIPILTAERRQNKKYQPKKKTDRKEPQTVKKYTSGEFLGGLQGLHRLHDTLEATVCDKWGLERGERGSDAVHTNQVEYNRNLKIKEKKFEDWQLKKFNDLKVNEKQLDVRSSAVEEAEKIIEKRKSNLQEAEKQLDVRSSAVEEAEKIIEKRKSNLQEVENEYIEKNKVLKKEIDDFNKIVNGAMDNEKHMLVGEALQTLRNERVSIPEALIFWKKVREKIGGFFKAVIDEIRQEKQEQTQTQTRKKSHGIT